MNLIIFRVYYNNYTIKWLVRMSNINTIFFISGHSRGHPNRLNKNNTNGNKPAV